MQLHIVERFKLKMWNSRCRLEQRWLLVQILDPTRISNDPTQQKLRFVIWLYFTLTCIQNINLWKCHRPKACDIFILGLWHFHRLEAYNLLSYNKPATHVYVLYVHINHKRLSMYPATCHILTSRQLPSLTTARILIADSFVLLWTAFLAILDNRQI